jgi:hypothetical protein
LFRLILSLSPLSLSFLRFSSFRFDLGGEVERRSLGAGSNPGNESKEGNDEKDGAVMAEGT